MDKLEEIKKIKHLLDDGIIDEDDFLKKKAEILGMPKEEEKIIEEVSKNETKSKSLDDYEKELMAQSEIEEETNEKFQIKVNNDYYQQEKLKAKAKLDAEEEIREKRKNETKAAVNKSLNGTKKILKWILSVALWIFGVASIATTFNSGWVYIPIGIIMILQGCLACPKITDYTQNNPKFEAYTMHKTIIVIITLILWLVLACAFPSTSNTETNNTQLNEHTNTQN